MIWISRQIWKCGIFWFSAQRAPPVMAGLNGSLYHVTWCAQSDWLQFPSLAPWLIITFFQTPCHLVSRKSFSDFNLFLAKTELNRSHDHELKRKAQFFCLKKHIIFCLNAIYTAFTATTAVNAVIEGLDGSIWTSYFPQSAYFVPPPRVKMPTSKLSSS
jgi:hypothetical protein